LQFNEVWEELKSLEGKTLATLVYDSQNHIIMFSSNFLLREVVNRDRTVGFPIEVPRRAFENLWNALILSGDVFVKDAKLWRICAAGFVDCPKLKVIKISDKPLTIRKI